MALSNKSDSFLIFDSNSNLFMLDIVQIVLKWKKQIFIFCVFSIIASIILSMPFIMHPYYKSKQIFYLSNPISTDRAALFNEKEVGGVSIFGGKEDINRFLSILNSEVVISSIIKNNDLTKHYNIEGDNIALSHFYTQKEFSSNFKAIRNDLGAIEVSILDTDAKLAAKMVQEIVQLSDSIYRTILSENKSIILNLLDKQIDNKQTQTLNIASAEELQKLITIRDQYAVSSSAAFKTTFTVEEAVPAVKKEKPVRWMIVLGTALCSFFMATFIAILIELFKHATHKESEHH
ncbi:MAG TPA: hypothetical protein PLJ42_04060 [Chitinophagales bacterium]|nr:hypothetical protein [Chitinophagales bacterium]HQV77865.1 hypothetical protein [Chitinophagales bacterium]HQW78586.1 hypothetical protein [Chitinophagales bacterium]HRB19209.1 hypothetical protein [Chitinophagales bacterium]